MSKKRRKNLAADELGKFKVELKSELAGREVFFRGTVGEKMSEVIEEFIAPYPQYATTLAEYQCLIATAIIAWNTALAPETKRAALLSDTLKAIAPKGERQTQADFYAIVGEMIERKEKCFASNRRYIVNYRVTATPAGMHLSIASLIK
jgi:hypothetical protein